jgi:beta-1,4-mannooligosaccharide/beta-1,4-mannosyl-N-acetylglucosamine phosphorylase
MFLNESPDMIHWGHHRHVMSPASGWQATKVGAGPTPIETTEGWLMIYHGVPTSCNGFVYSFGAALLDLEEPWRVLYRTVPYLLNSREYYECVGDVPNVVFPSAALHDPPTGRIGIYYGASPKALCPLFPLVIILPQPPSAALTSAPTLANHLPPSTGP